MRPLICLLVVVLSLAGPWAGAEESGDQDLALDLEEIREIRARVVDDPALSEDIRARVIELYDSAISSLEAAQENHRAAASVDVDRANIQRSVEVLREQLSRPDPPLSREGLDDLTAEQAESALARERSRLTAHRSTVRTSEQRAEDRSKRRNDIARQLGELDQEMELLNEEHRRVTQRDLPDAVKTAAQIEVLARREATLGAMAKLRTSLILLEEGGALVPLELDHAQRKVARSEARLALLETINRDLRHRAAAESLLRVESLATAVIAETPELAEFASETQGLAQELWGADGVSDRSEETVKAVLATRAHLADVNRIVELTRRKFEAFGHRGSIGRWWPDVPDDLPDVDTVTATIQQLDQEIPEIQYRMISHEEERAGLQELARQIVAQIRSEYGEDLDPERLENLRQLFTLHRDLLDKVTSEYGRYSNQLVEYRTLSTHFRDRMMGIERFIYSHVLWSRSVPRPIIPRVSDLAAATKWFTSPAHRQAINSKTRGEGVSVLRRDFLSLALLILVIVFRKRILRRLKALSERVADPSTDAFRWTLEALFWTAALTLPLPLVFQLASRVLLRAGGAAYFNTAASALGYVAAVALLIEGARQLFLPHGLGEAHFGWPAKVTRPLHRGLILPEIIALPLLVIAVDLGLAGFRLDSRAQLQIYNNSLGRVAFVISMFLLGISILALLRPEKKDQRAARELPFTQRFSQYAFPTVFLVAYPIIFLATIIPALLATFGYYITGVLLAYQMERTLLLGLAVLVGGGLLYRWRISQTNAALSRLDPDEPDPAALNLISTAADQTRQLLGVAVIVVITFGMVSIWSDALPMLQILKRVQILPTVAILEAQADRRLESLEAAAEPSPENTETSAESDSQSETAVAPAPVPLPGATAPKTTAAAEEEQLTLWSLIQAILLALVTLMLVKNLPALFELFLSRRTNLDSGSRVAFATLVRYSITILGVLIVFGVLGVTWDNVQWLVAALTFGLAFGLQEIVANFVSGLILLIERPIRVGDMVTVGNLMGRVSRIQIRATTITLFDRSEMIVPNKEFITTKLVNWTLSDSKRRIEIPIRIAYGEDLERVKRIVNDIASQHPEVLDDPAPHTLLLSFGDDASQLELRFVVDFGKGLAIRDQVQMAIEVAFREAGIEFALPQRTIHVVSQQPDDDQPPVENPEMD